MPCHYFAMATVTTNGKECSIFSLIIEGTTEKVSQFIMPISQFEAKTFLEQKCIFEQFLKGSNKKYLYNHIINV
jgi:hypothetical protein